MADSMLRVGGRGPDGTAKPLKTDTEGKLEVQIPNGIPQLDTFAKGWATQTFMREAGSLALDSQIILINSGRPVKLNSFVITTNNPILRIDITSILEDGSAGEDWRVPRKEGNLVTITPKGIFDNFPTSKRVGFFEILEYNTTNNFYAIQLKDVIFPTGVRILLRSQGTTPESTTYTMTGQMVYSA